MAVNLTDDARRDYWIEQTDAAMAFMRVILSYPVEECGEPLVSLRDALDAPGLDVVFFDKSFGEGLTRLFYIREGLAGDVRAIARDMNDRGWVLLIEDAYRSRAMQTSLARRNDIFDAILRTTIWELNGRTPTPEELYRRVAVLIATVPKVGTHMSGSALDISVLSRDVGGEIDRGGPYTATSEVTPMASPFVSEAAQANRRAITDLMARHGFVAYPWEFWHYSKGDAYDACFAGAGRPGRYGAIDFDPVTGHCEPIADPLEPLNTPDTLCGLIDAALKRLKT